MKLLLTTLLFTLTISAADFSGKWTGSFVDDSSGGKSETAVVVLKHTGGAVTGTAGPTAEEQMPISNGKVDGNTVSFDVNAGDVVIHFTLTFADNHLKGQAKGESNGEKHSATLDLTKAE